MAGAKEKPAHKGLHRMATTHDRFALSEIQQAFETASSDDPDYVKGIVVNDVE